MSLFLNLYLGHLLGDFLLQPGRLVQAKRTGVAGKIAHTFIVGAATAVVVFATIRVDWPAVVLVAGLHMVIDQLTIATYTGAPTRGLFTLLLDQALHVLSIGLVVYAATGTFSADLRVTTLGLTVSTTLLAAVDGLVCVTLYGAILAFESGNAALAGASGKGRLLRLDAPRVGGMLERGIALAASRAAIEERIDASFATIERVIEEIAPSYATDEMVAARVAQLHGTRKMIVSFGHAL
jgi:hypothetical protein